jgi:site-specific DNA-cytosine methylase
LESEVDEKYFLSEKMVNYLQCRNTDGFGKGKLKYKDEEDIAFCITKSSSSIDISDNILKVKFATSNQGVIQLNQSKESEGKQPYQQNRIYDSNALCPALNAGQETCGGNIVTLYNDKRLNETIEKNTLLEGEIKMLDTYNQTIHDECPTLKARHAQNNDRKLWDGYQIRRLTPRECFRLMDFPDSFTWPVSDSQAYKQAGNSIVVNVLYKILKNLNI